MSVGVVIFFSFFFNWPVLVGRRPVDPGEMLQTTKSGGRLNLERGRAGLTRWKKGATEEFCRDDSGGVREDETSKRESCVERNLIGATRATIL